MSTLEILKAARALLDDPAYWIAHGSLGAIREVTANIVEEDDAESALMEFTGDDVLPSEFDKTHGHADVLAVFDQAIAKLAP